MAIKTTRIGDSIRFPGGLRQQLKDLHATTFPEHRKSWNQWIVDILQEYAEVHGNRPT